MAIEITVQGQHTARFAAERGTVHLVLSFDGADREVPLAQATSTAKVITEQLATLHNANDGPVVSWSSDRVRVWADRPWNNQGKQLPLVHHAQIGISATFNDFEVLAAVLGPISLTDGVQLGGISWTLTESSRLSARAEVRTQAVADATDKARAYAKAVGLENVAVVALADPGMLGVHGGESAPRMEMMMARSGKMADSVAPEFEFTPEEIEIAASVDARFTAS